MGDWKSHGARKRMSLNLGLPTNRGNHLGQDESALTYYSNRQNRALVTFLLFNSRLNHSKEHCLVGIKGNPKIKQFIDCDVIVSEVRETSRKPDEIYYLIDRMFPGGNNLEIFGRPHNCRNGWLTLGNQLEGVFLKDEAIK